MTYTANANSSLRSWHIRSIVMADSCLSVDQSSFSVASEVRQKAAYRCDDLGLCGYAHQMVAKFFLQSRSCEMNGIASYDPQTERSSGRPRRSGSLTDNQTKLRRKKTI